VGLAVLASKGHCHGILDGKRSTAVWTRPLWLMAEANTQEAKARLVRVAVPGNTALDAAHWYPCLTMDELRARGDPPNIVREFLQSWAFRLSWADFECRTLKVDCGMVFRAPIPPEWIVEIETLEAQK